MKIPPSAGKETPAPASFQSCHNRPRQRADERPYTLPTADDERYGTFALIRRLLTEQGLTHWRAYAFGFTLMAVSAGCTALSAYLIGNVINEAYVNKNLSGIFILGGVTVALFATKGVATYGHSVLLSQIGNRIVADNQRRVFAKLLQRGHRLFLRPALDRVHRPPHSAGAAAATQVINLLITSLGRDLLSLIGLVTVMVVAGPADVVLRLRGGAAGSAGAAQAGPPRAQGSRATSSPAAPASSRRMQETLQGIRIVKAFALEDAMRERFDGNVARSSTRPTSWRASPAARAR